MRSLGPSQSPVVARTFHQRLAVQSSRSALVWGLVNLLLAIVMYLVISWDSIVYHLNWSHPFIWYAEYGLAALFTVKTVLDFLKYLGITFSAVAVEITPLQKKLLGIKDNDPGFRTVSPKPSSDSGAGLVISPSSFTAHSSFSGSSTPMPSPYSPGSPFLPLGRITPPSYTQSGLYSHTPSPTSRTPSPLRQGLSTSYTGSGLTHSGSFVQPSGSFVENYSPHSSFSQSFNASYSRSGNVSPLSTTNNLSPLFHESMDTSGLRSRLHNVSARVSPNVSMPLPAEECITDQKSLHSFLKEQEEKERSHLGSPDSNTSAGPSFWNYNRSMADYTPILRKYQYQIACRSPQSTKSRDTDPDDPATYRGNEVWPRLGVYTHELEQWTENMRKWLSQTIMNRLAEEIRTINAKLVRLGSEELQIGEVSISTLKQVAMTKAQHIPSLNTVVPYLECSANQEYLVNRIMDLGSGGAMSDFHWNDGCEFKGKSWNEHLPTDAAIVMHALCTYMDSRLPPHPKYPDGKTFTSQHFLRCPDKPDLKKEDNLLLYQSKVNPPHFKVIIGDDTWDLQKGRNNMFHAILLFLYHVKTKEHGMLGRVNLGLSGINVLWVLEKKM